MSEIRFQSKKVIAQIRNPLKEFKLTKEEIEIRTDPLLGYTMRITKPKGLDKVPEGEPLDEFVTQSKPCFFCEGKVENQTPMMPQSIYEKGRIKVGESLLFPNLSGFGKYSGVCIFSKQHYTAIQDLTEELIFNVLKACRIYFQVCAKEDKETLFPSINGNYLLPAGSSILHPHLQPFLDPIPTNFHKQLLNAGQAFRKKHNLSYWEILQKQEKTGPRFLFETEHSFFFTPFAPTGFNEVNGLMGTGETYIELTDDMLWDFADGIQKILKFYHHIEHNSFNLVILSSSINSQPGATMPCILKICTRPVFTPYYRNDITFFERFHGESMIDKTPEEVAAEFINYN